LDKGQPTSDPVRILLVPLVFLFVSLALPPHAVAAEEAVAAEDMAEATGADSETPDTRIDRLHSATENLLDATVRRVDAFFVSEAHDTFEEDQNRLRLRLNLDYIEHAGWDFKEKVKINVRLTALSKRLRLLVNDADEDEDDQVTEYEDDGNDIALRWVGHQGKKTGLSLDAGVRIKSGNVDPFGRVNASIRYPVSGQWTGQSTNRIYYYSQTGWRNDFRQYFNRPINDELLFRARSRIQYFEEKDSNPQLEQKFTVFHTLSDRSAVAYEALWRQETAEDSVFDDSDIRIDPEDRYDQFQVRLRYRRNFWRPWMFFEVWPAVSWPEERDWQTVLGARVRLEINFGRHVGPKLDE
jgi:hypothetical protein